MLAHILQQELPKHLRTWSVPLFFLLLLAMGIASVAWEEVQMGGFRDTHQNSPYAIADRVLVASVLLVPLTFLRTLSALGGSSRSTGFASGRPVLLWGPPAGAMMASMIVLAALPLGIWIGSLLPAVDASRIGPTRIEAHLFALVVLGLPNVMLVASCTTVLAAHLSPLRLLFALVGVAALWVGSLALRPLGWPGQLLEPFGLTAYFEATATWTSAERNTVLVGEFGVLFANRALWLVVSLSLFAAAARRLRRGAAAEASWANLPLGELSKGRMGR